MKTIYTSYFSNARKLREKNIIVVGIARFPPRFCKCDYHWKEVAPTSDMLSMNWNDYIVAYDRILRKLNPDKVREILDYLSSGRDVALCCFETPEKQCHRHLLARWIFDNLGIDVKEWVHEKIEKPQAKILTLF